MKITRDNPKWKTVEKQLQLPKRFKWKVFPTNHALSQATTRKLFIPHEIQFTQNQIDFVELKDNKPQTVGVGLKAYKDVKIVYVFSCQSNTLVTVYKEE